MGTLVLLGNLCLAATALPLTLFVAGYGFTMDWRDRIAQHVWHFSAALNVSCILGLIRWGFGASLDVPWFITVRVAGLAYIAFVAWWRYLVWKRARAGE